MRNLFVKPAVGLWFGAYNGNKDNEDGGNGGLVLGDWVLQIGLLLGGVVGFGKKFGLYSGLMTGFALIPLLKFGFIGLPFGVHYKQRFGIGIIVPFYIVNTGLHTLLMIALGLVITLIFFAVSEKR